MRQQKENLERLKGKKLKDMRQNLGAKRNPTSGPSFEAPDVADSAYRGGMSADKAIEELQTLKDKPFFMCLGFVKPPPPLQRSQKYWDLYNRDDISPPTALPKGSPDVAQTALTAWPELRAYLDIPDEGPLSETKAKELIHGYYACVSYIDAQVGRSPENSRRSRTEKNTVVELWGDHGFKLGDYNA